MRPHHEGKLSVHRRQGLLEGGPAPRPVRRRRSGLDSAKRSVSYRPSGRAPPGSQNVDHALFGPPPFSGTERIYSPVKPRSSIRPEAPELSRRAQSAGSSKRRTGSTPPPSPASSRSIRVRSTSAVTPRRDGAPRTRPRCRPTSRVTPQLWREPVHHVQAEVLGRAAPLVRDRLDGAVGAVVRDLDADRVAHVDAHPDPALAVAAPRSRPARRGAAGRHHRSRLRAAPRRRPRPATLLLPARS